jgi:hypothetical protein
MAATHENRVRIVFNLPLNGPDEELAFNDVVAQLKGARKAELGVTGFTHSEPLPPVYHGQWWDGRSWIEDDIVVCIVDFPALRGPQSAIAGRVAALKALIHSCYARRRRPQAEVWVVLHRIVRV